MDIKRVDSFGDARFLKEILDQRGAYLIEGMPCSFKILDTQSAVVLTDYEGDLSEAIRLFRFHAEHITTFLDAEHHVIAHFKPVVLFERQINSLQPSQFYISHEKLEAVKTWVREARDVVVPLNRPNIIADGHTRLYYAHMLGLKTVWCYYTQPDEYLHDFVKEAQRRGLDTIETLEVLNAQD